MSNINVEDVERVHNGSINNNSSFSKDTYSGIPLPPQLK